MPGRQLRLRRPATCAVCLIAVDAGTEATWDSDRRTVTCLGCESDAGVEVQPGVAGASAVVEAERLREKQQARRQRNVEAHPILGRLAWALSPEPDAGRQYAKGAVGEQRLGAALNAMSGAGVLALHDRRLPGSKANIDHLVVTASGVWVIDAKRYSGRVAKVDKGGWFRTDMRLTVGGRDRTKLIGGVHKQVGHVQAALAEVPGDEPPVHGALCFVDADWALFRKPMTLDGVLVTWSKALRKRLVEDGPVDEEHRAAIHRSLARSFPPGG